jgi:hypothetical protein
MIVRWVRASCHHWVLLNNGQRELFWLPVGLLLFMAFCQLKGSAEESLRSSRLDNGLFQVESEHLKLVTDSPINESILELLTVFEQALPQWGKEFTVPESRWKEAKVTSYLMFDRNRFVEWLSEWLSASRHPFFAGATFCLLSTTSFFA